MIDINEVYRYLGFDMRASDIEMDRLVRECIDEVSQLMQKRYTYDVFHMEITSNQVKLKNHPFILPGRDIFVHLGNSVKCGIMAVTLGVEIERRLNYYSRTSLSRAIVLDACATAAVEGACDEVEIEIEKIAKSQGLVLTTRYSPGYGDFPISVQRDILRILDTHRRIGLTVTKEHILIPRKSVTAVVGLTKENHKCPLKGCRSCNKRNECIYCKGKECQYEF